MSQTNVEIVREHIEAFQSQDTPRAVSFLDSHVVWDASRMGGGPDAGDVLYGPESLVDFVRRYQGSFNGYNYTPERLTDLGSGAVVVVVTEAGIGRTSGVPVHRTYAVLYSVIAGSITRITLFPSEDAACEAVGRPE